METITEKYRNYLLLEKGFSPHTAEAYCSDVAKLLCYLDDEGPDLRHTRLDDLHRFAASLLDVGISPVSIARILSGVRSFFAFLLLDGYLEADPSELL